MPPKPTQPQNPTGAQHSPEHQEMAQKLGLNLGNIDFSKIAQILQFLASLLGQQQPGGAQQQTQPGSPPHTST